MIKLVKDQYLMNGKKLKKLKKMMNRPHRLKVQKFQLLTLSNYANIFII
jgi:hypothetical protein